MHALGGLRDALVPLLLAIFVGARNPTSGTIIAFVVLAFSVGVGYARWRATTYWVSDGALHFRSGVLSPDTQVVPIARIAAVDEVQGPVQRVFGVLALDVQTAGGGSGGEVRLHAVSPVAVAELRAVLGHPAMTVDAAPIASPAASSSPTADSSPAGSSSPTAAAPPSSPTPSWRLPRRMLVLTAITGPQLAVIAPVAGAVAAFAQQTISQNETRDLLRRAPDTVHGWALLVLALAAVVLLVALAGAVVAFAGFEVRREPERLRIRRGLLQRRTATVGIKRVHAIRIVEGVLRQPFGLCSVRLEVAGYARERAAAQTLVPLCRRSEVAAVLGALVPELPVPSEAAARPPTRAARRYLTVPVAAAVLAGVVVGVVVSVLGGPVWGWGAVVVFGAAGALVGWERWRAAGWWEGDGIVALRSRPVAARTITIASIHRLQHRELSASLPARRAGLASVGFAVASGARAAVGHLDAQVAETLFARLR